METVTENAVAPVQKRAVGRPKSKFTRFIKLIEKGGQMVLRRPGKPSKENFRVFRLEVPIEWSPATTGNALDGLDLTKAIEILPVVNPTVEALNRLVTDVPAQVNESQEVTETGDATTQNDGAVMAMA